MLFPCSNFFCLVPCTHTPLPLSHTQLSHFLLVAFDAFAFSSKRGMHNSCHIKWLTAGSRTDFRMDFFSFKTRLSSAVFLNYLFIFLGRAIASECAGDKCRADALGSFENNEKWAVSNNRIKKESIMCARRNG